MKLFLISRGLDLRARRPAAFSGTYEPLDAGPDVCAYLRGDEVLTVVPVRGVEDVWLRGAPGQWRDVLTGDQRGVPDEITVVELVEPYGLGLFERL
jgi:(1->4)-alpha-D-glucan 1-alpha-D-glucosylmutase